ncbi:MAG: thymidylate kinase, partial [Alphaproteobacteria bacterium]|nr:thymidylate kinase [Alphaproteobacteria bacterium]
TWVICDRFIDSTLVYQGYGQNIDKNLIDHLNKIIIDGFQPDLTFILDLPVEKGLKKAQNRSQKENRYEEMGLSFHNKLSDAFKVIAQNNPERCHIIETNQPMEQTALAIQHIIQKKFNLSMV